MEASFSSLFNAPLLVKQLQINPANVYINTIDVDYLPASDIGENGDCLLYTSPSPRDRQKSRMPSSA